MTEQFQRNEKLVVYEGDTHTYNAIAVLQNGQEVYLSANNTVALRTNVATQYTVGIVKVPATTAGDKVVVQTHFSSVQQGVAKGGTLNAGAFVKHNNTLNANGLPEYVLAVTGDRAIGQIVIGGAVDTVVRVGVLKSNVVVP